MYKHITIGSDGDVYYDGERPPEPPKKNPSTISVFEFLEKIRDEASATAFLEEKRWGGSPKCPRCGTCDIRYVPDEKPMPFHCPDCRRYFSVRTGTVMAHSRIPLRKWLYALYLFHTHRKGISARQLQKELGIGKKAAWFLGHRIRKAMEFRGPLLAGAVEIDETLIGGKEPNKHFDKRMNGPARKQPLLGFRERETGTVVAYPIDKVDTETLHWEIMMTVEPGSLLYTDGHAGYRDIDGYDHAWVNHSTKEYVRGDVHTNGIESFWANFKRAYMGTHHYMSHTHLHRYADECAFRLNSGPGNDFDTIGETVASMEGKGLLWKELTGRMDFDFDIDIYNLPDWLARAA